jgi:hypothetical protein
MTKQGAMNLYSTEGHSIEVTQRYRREAETARLIARAPRRSGRVAPMMATLTAFVRRLTLVRERRHEPRPALGSWRRPI